MKVCFYKGIHPGIAGVYSVVVRTWTRTPYSHCELVFSDGTAASSSMVDKGVRYIPNWRGYIDDPKDWDVIELPDCFEPAARKWYDDHLGQGYDVIGNLHFVLNPIGDDKEKWFCSESVAAALGFENPGRFNPGDLYEILKRVAELYTTPALVPLAA